MRVAKRIDLKEVIDGSVSDLDIFKHYLGNITIGRPFCSVLRKDKNPSCNLYMSKSNTLRYKDHATGDNYSAIGYVQALYNLSYPDALKKIAADFNLSGSEFEVKPILKTFDKQIIVQKQKTDIKITPKKFTEKDLNYWSSYGISYDTLKLFNVYSVDKLWIKKQPMLIKKDELCFAYYFPKSNHLKIYFPERKKANKWFSNTDNLSDIQGYYQMDIKNTRPAFFVLTSSLKEVMLLWEFGIKSVAIHGENATYDPDFIRHVKKYCTVIKSLYDWDEAGQRAGEKLKAQYNIPIIEKPDYLTCKDISDCHKESPEKAREFLNKLRHEQTELGTF